MKIRLGKAFLEECKIRGYFEFRPDADERGAVIFNVLDRATKTKTGLSVEVTEFQLGHFIEECEWFVISNQPEDSTDDLKNYYNLKNQLKALKKVQENG